MTGCAVQDRLAELLVHGSLPFARAERWRWWVMEFGVPGTLLEQLRSERSAEDFDRPLFDDSDLQWRYQIADVIERVCSSSGQSAAST